MSGEQEYGVAETNTRLTESQENQLLSYAFFLDLVLGFIFAPQVASAGASAYIHWQRKNKQSFNEMVEEELEKLGISRDTVLDEITQEKHDLLFRLLESLRKVAEHASREQSEDFRRTKARFVARSLAGDLNEIRLQEESEAIAKLTLRDFLYLQTYLIGKPYTDGIGFYHLEVQQVLDEFQDSVEKDRPEYLQRGDDYQLTEEEVDDYYFRCRQRIQEYEQIKYRLIGAGLLTVRRGKPIMFLTPPQLFGDLPNQIRDLSDRIQEIAEASQRLVTVSDLGYRVVKQLTETERFEAHEQREKELAEEGGKRFKERMERTYPKGQFFKYRPPLEFDSSQC